MTTSGTDILCVASWISQLARCRCLLCVVNKWGRGPNPLMHVAYEWGKGLQLPPMHVAYMYTLIMLGLNLLGVRHPSSVLHTCGSVWDNSLANSIRSDRSRTTAGCAAFDQFYSLLTLNSILHLYTLKGYAGCSLMKYICLYIKYKFRNINWNVIWDWLLDSNQSNLSMDR